MDLSSIRLASIAEYSNLLSVFTVLLCFGVMVIFILTLRNMDLTQPSTQRVRVPQAAMERVRLPFSCHLENASFDSGATFRTTSTVAYVRSAYWGVRVRELHGILEQQWGTPGELEEKLAEYSQQSQMPVDSDPHDACDVTFPVPRPGELDLGMAPRLCYPLVVLARSVDPNEMTCLATVVHIHDSTLPLSTRVVGQFLKLSSGRLLNLQQLYVGSSSIDTGEGEACLVCFLAPPSRAILPCRHACVCAGCFSKLDRCPICRGEIASYFPVKSNCGEEEEEDNQDVEEEVPPATSQSFGERLAHWNDRLNDVLGFH